MSEDSYFQLKRPSKRSGKKWQIRVPTENGRGKTVIFGDAKMEDYTIHHDKTRRENYRRRHMHDRINDPHAAGYWSWWSLWGESTDLKKAHAAAVARAKKILGVKSDGHGNQVATKTPSNPRGRRNPNPPGTPSPTMADVSQVVVALGVPKHLRTEFVQGFAIEWEHAHTVGYDLMIIGSIVFDHLAEDENYYRKLRRARLNPPEDDDATEPSDRVQSCFDALLSVVQEQYPSLRCHIEVDDSAGEHGGKSCTRAYAFCEDLEDGSFRISVAGKLNDAEDSRVEGLLQHELAHSVLLHTGDMAHTERDADEVAAALFGMPLYYDEDDVQTTDPSAPGARKPRPSYLDDENGRTMDSAYPGEAESDEDEDDAEEERENPMQLQTVDDVIAFLDDCAAQGDAKSPRMLASQFSQQAQEVPSVKARMLSTLARAARSRANAIEARLAGNIESAIASENLSERALADVQGAKRAEAIPVSWRGNPHTRHNPGECHVCQESMGRHNPDCTYSRRNRGV